MFDLVLKRDLDNALYFEPRSSKGDTFLAGMFVGYADRDVPNQSMVEMALFAERKGLRVASMWRSSSARTSRRNGPDSPPLTATSMILGC